MNYGALYGYLVIASSECIKVIEINYEHWSDSVSNLSKNDLIVREVNPKLKLIGVIPNNEGLHFGFETEDNQLDFNKLEVENFQEDDSYKINFI